MLLHEKLAVCHTRDTPRLTGCRCGSCFERKMPESKKNAVATPVLTRNNRDSMAPATAANGLRTVTPQRSTWSNHADPLRRSRCRWSFRAPLNYEGVDTEILISRAKLWQ